MQMQPFAAAEFGLEAEEPVLPLEAACGGAGAARGRRGHNDVEDGPGGGGAGGERSSAFALAAAAAIVEVGLISPATPFPPTPLEGKTEVLESLRAELEASKPPGVEMVVPSKAFKSAALPDCTSFYLAISISNYATQVIDELQRTKFDPVTLKWATEWASRTLAVRRAALTPVARRMVQAASERRSGLRARRETRASCKSSDQSRRYCASQLKSFHQHQFNRELSREIIVVGSSSVPRHMPTKTPPASLYTAYTAVTARLRPPDLHLHRSPPQQRKRSNLQTTLNPWKYECHWCLAVKVEDELDASPSYFNLEALSEEQYHHYRKENLASTSQF